MPAVAIALNLLMLEVILEVKSVIKVGLSLSGVKAKLHLAI